MIKFYDFKAAPSPTRVRIFIAEKKLTVETISVNLIEGEHLQESFKKINPWLTLPVIELDDGTTISEISACCRYLEEINPQPFLMGKDAKEKALIEMWNAHMENDGYAAAVDLYRNTTEGYETSAKTGPNKYKQIPEIAVRAKEQLNNFYNFLNLRLEKEEFICGEDFSIADITAFVTINFAKWKKIEISKELSALIRWYNLIKDRPSSKV